MQVERSANVLSSVDELKALNDSGEFEFLGDTSSKKH